MIFDEILSLRPERSRPAEIGFEKEYRLEAISRADDSRYNLEAAPALLRALSGSLDHAQAVEEYSRCLIEIVTPPVAAEEVWVTLETLNRTAPNIEDTLRKTIYSSAPKLAQEYGLRIADDGSASSALYLDLDGAIRSQLTDAAALVLPPYERFVEARQALSWTVGGRTELCIGMYATINSFHITLHPTYAAERPYREAYIDCLERTIQALVRLEGSTCDNRILERDWGTVDLGRSVRDAFLECLAASAPFAGRFIAGASRLAVGERLEEVTEGLTTAGTSPDEGLRSWNTLDLRPRVLPDGMPLIEVRRFPSCFSRQPEVVVLLSKILNSRP